MIKSHFAILQLNLEWVASQVETSATRPRDPWRQIERVWFASQSEGSPRTNAIWRIIPLSK